MPSDAPRAVTPLAKPSDAELADALEETIFGLFRAMATLPGGALSEDDRLAMHTSFPISPLFSGVWNARIPANEVDAEITRAQEWMRQHQARTFLWWICSGTRPANLGEHLLQRGFIANIVGDPCLAIALDAQAAAPSPAEMTHAQSMPSLVIEEAITSNTFNDWRAVYRQAQELPDFSVQSYQDAARAFPSDKIPWRAYVGYAGGEAVSAVMLIPGARVGWLYGLSTLHAARARGYGATLARHALEVARTLGYQHVVTYAVPEAVAFFEQLGFYQIGATLSRYLYYFRP